MKRFAERLNTELGGAAVALAPLIAPVPSVWAVWSAIGGWDGIAVALAVELLGFGAAHTALRAYHRRQSDDSLLGLMAVALILFAFYVVAVYAVLLGYKGISAALALPLLTIAGAGMYGINSQLDAAEAEPERQIELDDKRLRLADERKALRRQMSHQVSQSVLPATVALGIDVSQADILRQLESAMRHNPNIGLRPLGAAAGVSKDTAKRIVAAAGWHKNGNGWEIVEETT
jgi:hypothetical protein